MRIAIDARELAPKPTGVGRYLTELLRAWAHEPASRAHEFVLCAPAEPDAPVLAGPGARWVTAPGHGTVWEQWVLPRLLRRVRPDVLFSPAYTSPIWGPTPVVVAIHDVSFFAQPGSYRPREGARRRFVTRRAAHRAARVLTISEFSRREIVRWLGVEADKVEVTYPGVTTLAGTTKASHRPHDDRPTVLYVGSVFSRRHVPELVAGFTRLAQRHTDVRLEVVGDNRSIPPVDLMAITAATGLGDRIRVRPYVSDGELATLYAQATAFAFLSDYEGFGLTPLEALALDIPIVVLDTAVAREVYGDAARYVTTLDAASVADGLAQVLFDEAARSRWRDAGRARVARYSWSACAARTLEVLTACGSRR